MAALAAIVLCLCAAASSALALETRARNGLVTIEADRAPLGEVLTELAEAAGFDLRLAEPLDLPTTISLRYAPAPEALARLLANSSWVAEQTVGEDGRPRIARVLVLSHNAAAAPGAELTVSGDLSDIADLKTRIAALQDLIQHPDPEMTADLAAMAVAGDDPTRSLATIALGQLDTTEARDALRRAYGDENPVIRRWAVKGIGERWGRAAFEDLAEALLHDPDPLVRREALLRMSLMEGDSAAQHLSLALDDDSPVVRKVARNVVDFRERKGVR